MKTIRYIISLILLYSLSGIVLNAQTLDELLKIAINENPELKAVHLQYEAKLQEADQQSQLPNFQAGVGVPVSRPETRLGPQVLTISANQMFPWFGTLNAKKNVKLLMAKADYERILEKRLNLFYQIETAYYKLYAIGEKQKIISDNLKIYKALEELALSNLEGGKITIADVLRIQLKIQEYSQQTNILENKKPKFYAIINEAINRPMSNIVYTISKIDTIAFLNFDTENFRNKIKNHHPLIATLNWNIQASKKKQDLNKLSALPSIGVGIDYSVVNERKGVLLENNGRDILVPKIMLKFPLSKKRRRAKHREEEFNQQALSFRLKHLENQILSMLQSYKTEYDEAILIFELKTLQKRTLKSAFEVLLSEYSGKGKGLNDLLEVQSEIIKNELDLLNAKIQTYLAKSNIDRLINF